jgi:membrane fusion protein (multidrug efflux system)
VQNRDGVLKGGSFVKGQVLVGRRTGVLQVRRDALLNWNLDARKAEVFVITGDKAQKREVATGAGSGSSVEVLSGVQPGDQVVTRGGFALRDGDRVSVSKGEGA